MGYVASPPRYELHLTVTKPTEYSHPGDRNPPWDKIASNPDCFYDDKFYELVTPIAPLSSLSNTCVYNLALCLSQLPEPFAFRSADSGGNAEGNSGELSHHNLEGLERLNQENEDDGENFLHYARAH
jgi:hypothetical protein